MSQTSFDTISSCSNGLLDIDEYGVDCGGACGSASCCNNGAQELDESGIDCGRDCSQCVRTEENTGRCKVRTTNSVGARCSGDYSPACIVPDSYNFRSGTWSNDCDTLYCGNLLSGWQADNTCRTMREVGVCKPGESSAESCFKDDLDDGKTATMCAKLKVGISDNILGACEPGK